jgi:hypothetical protein
MTTIVFDELDEFMDLLKAVDHEKPIYVRISRETHKEIVLGSVIVFTLFDSSVYAYEHREDIPSVRLIPDLYFSNIDDDKLREDEYSRYKARFDNFEDALGEELTKMYDVLKALGFKKIYHGHLLM